MAHGSSATAIAEAVRAIMMAKNVDHLYGHSNTKNFDRLKEQLAKACATVCATTWRGQHVGLPLALSKFSLARTTNGAQAATPPPHG